MEDRVNVELFFNIILLLIVFIDLIRKIKRRNKILLVDFAVWFTGLVFGLTPIIILLYSGSLPLIKIQVIVFTYIGILLFLSGLMITKFFSPLRKEMKKSETPALGIILGSADKIHTAEIVLLYFFVLLIRYIYLTEYEIFVSGTATLEKIEAVPYFMFGLKSLSEIILFGCLVWAISILFIKKKIIFFPLLIILVEFSISFFFGRRWMLFIFVLLFVILLVLNIKIKFKVILPSILLFILMTTVIFPYFISFRDFYLWEAQSGDIVGDIRYSYNKLQTRRGTTEQYEINIEQRAYIVGWNMDIITKNLLFDGLYGQAILSNVLWAIPSFIFPAKFASVNPETFVNASTGLRIVDSPSNWAGYGFADFGVLGGFFAGLLLGSILIFVEFIAFKLKDKMKFVPFFLIGNFLFIVYSVEDLPTATFSLIRDSFLLSVVFLIFKELHFLIAKKKKALIK